MENLIRIKLNPRRGGVSPIDFRRPRFCLSGWPGGEVEVWTSVNGIVWEKLDESDYSVSFEPSQNRAYITLLFDISSILYLGFFPGGGNVVGIGYELEKYDRISVGWDVEGNTMSQIPAGCSFGSDDVADVQAGYTIEGAASGNCGVGYRLKFPEVACFPVGGWIAAPCDADISIGFGIGICDGALIVVGAATMGLCELAGEVIPLDEYASGGLCGEAAWRKQKIVQLDGVTPKELD
jgi:hypothetical protein